MGKFFATVIAVIMVSTLTAAQIRETPEQMAARIAEENRNVHYSFYSDVDDKISDLTQHREEVRDGPNVMGSYSYSDGFFKRTISYVADDQGYRVVGENVEPLNRGPQVNAGGEATVLAQSQDGSLVHYRIQQVPDN